MSTSPSIGSEAVNMPAKLRGLCQGQKPEIKIILNNKQTSYTTFEQLEGTVSITSPNDLVFDDIEIEFVGTSRTLVERLTTAAAVSGKSEAFHQFLKLQQPGLADLYPQDKVLAAGKKYDFPFVFVIPDQLLPKICQHKIVSDTVKHAHLGLPPTLGGPSASDKIEGAAEDKAIHDDMCPDMASIRYGVFAKISKTKNQGGELVRSTVGSRAKQLRVIPARSEEPPLDTEGKDSEYTMRKERTIRKGVLQGKLGTIVMEAVQPPAMVLRSGSDSNSMAIIRLRFDPIDDRAQPPRLANLESKIKVCTYFASTARSTFPTKATAISDLSQGMHCEQLDLSKCSMTNREWTKHQSGKRPALERRETGESTASAHASASRNIFTEPSAAYKGGAYFTAVLEMPITLPKNKTFVPTFHTCLVSRIYQIKFELGLQTAGIVGSVDLKLPFQITSSSSGSRSSSRRSSIDSTASEELGEGVYDFLQPRNVSTAPPPDYSRLTRRTQEAPPSYSSFAPRALPVY